MRCTRCYSIRSLYRREEEENEREESHKRRGGGGGSVDVARTPGFLGGGTPSLFPLVQGNSSHFCICTPIPPSRPVPSRPLSEALFGYQVQGQRRQLTQNRDGTGISCNILPALPCLVSPCLTSCLFLSVMPNGVWCGCLCLLSTVTKYFIFHFPQYSYVF